MSDFGSRLSFAAGLMWTATWTTTAAQKCTHLTTEAACMGGSNACQWFPDESVCQLACWPEPRLSNYSCSNYCTYEHKGCIGDDLGTLSWDDCLKHCPNDDTCKGVSAQETTQTTPGQCYMCNDNSVQADVAGWLLTYSSCKPCSEMTPQECQHSTQCQDDNGKCLPQCTFTLGNEDKAISQCDTCGREGYEVESYLEAFIENQDPHQCFHLCEQSSCDAYSIVADGAIGSNNATCVLGKSPFFLVKKEGATTYMKGCRKPADFCQNYITQTECTSASGHIGSTCMWDAAASTCKPMCGAKSFVNADGTCSNFCRGENFVCPTPTSQPQTVQTVDECENICKNTAGCTGYVFDPADSSCVACEATSIVSGGRSTTAGYANCEETTTTTPTTTPTTTAPTTPPPVVDTESNVMDPAGAYALGRQVAQRSNNILFDASMGKVGSAASRAPLGAVALVGLTGLAVVAVVASRRRSASSSGEPRLVEVQEEE